MINFISKDKANKFFKGADALAIATGDFVLRNKVSEFINKYNKFCDFVRSDDRLDGSVAEIEVSDQQRARFKSDPTCPMVKLEPSWSTLANNFGRFYLPALRGMRPLDKDNDLFKSRTIADYFSIPGFNAENVITGYNLYDLLARFLLGKPGQREVIKRYEKLLGDHFFNGNEVTLIPQYDGDTVAVKIGDEDQFPIYDLGDGLQQVIIITSAAFLTEEFSVFFVEEPEIFLHPGLLQKLAVFLLEFTDHQFVAVSHSNHLLDLAESRNDVSINKVKKERNEGGLKFLVESKEQDQEILEALGVTPSSLFLANSSIWVEGITDRLYLRRFMQKYIEELSDDAEKSLLSSLSENFHYTFVEYQGAALSHWSFSKTGSDGDENDNLSALKASSNIFLIADGDIKNKGDRADRLKTSLSEKFYILDCKEIENLLPLDVLKGTAANFYETKRTKKDFVNIYGLEKLKYETYSNSLRDGIGRFLDRACGVPKESRFFSEDSGTIKNKLRFCKIALSVMDEIEWDLTDEVRDICSAVFEHVKSCNYLS
tara:strand:+ start:3153 stop:4778 length:1626 start_codon:yes stop_codon:yes gene_type:complete